jgi:hypothetical protein
VAETKQYDLTGQGGIDVWRNLPDGTTITLTNGAVGEITANPHDGGWILVKFREHPDASKVGEEVFVMFNEVKEATG